jgi:hypothetical protein
MGEARIPGDLPQEPVRIGKVPRIPTPISCPSGLDDPATRGRGSVQEAVRLCSRPDVVRQSHSRKPGTVGGNSRVSRQQVPGIERQPGPSQLEECDGRRRLEPGQTETFFVEPDRPLQIPNTKSYKADPGFHGVPWVHVDFLVAGALPRIRYLQR